MAAFGDDDEWVCPSNEEMVELSVNSMLARATELGKEISEEDQQAMMAFMTSSQIQRPQSQEEFDATMGAAANMSEEEFDGFMGMIKMMSPEEMMAGMMEAYDGEGFDAASGSVIVSDEGKLEELTDEASLAQIEALVFAYLKESDVELSEKQLHALRDMDNHGEHFYFEESEDAAYDYNVLGIKDAVQKKFKEIQAMIDEKIGGPARFQQYLEDPAAFEAAAQAEAAAAEA